MSSRAIALSYLGASVGDLLSGVLSQILKSRRKAVMIFLAHSFICVVIFCFFTNGWTNTSLYTIFVTIAAEQFGTNIRATVTTTVPNFARGTLVPVTLLFTEMTPALLSAPNTAAILALLCFGISLYSIMTIEETFGKDLDYLEMKLMTREGEPKK